MLFFLKKKGNEERQSQLPLLSKTVGDRTTSVADSVGMRLQAIKRSIQEDKADIELKIKSLAEKVED